MVTGREAIRSGECVDHPGHVLATMAQDDEPFDGEQAKSIVSDGLREVGDVAEQITSRHRVGGSGRRGEQQLDLRTVAGGHRDPTMGEELLRRGVDPWGLEERPDGFDESLDRVAVDQQLDGAHRIPHTERATGTSENVAPTCRMHPVPDGVCPKRMERPPSSVVVACHRDVGQQVSEVVAAERDPGDVGGELVVGAPDEGDGLDHLDIDGRASGEYLFEEKLADSVRAGRRR
ncbi:MAG: hypothetical protein R2697_19755 [Ilumatobacteraceae bacterium]